MKEQGQPEPADDLISKLDRFEKEAARLREIAKSAQTSAMAAAQMAKDTYWRSKWTRIWSIVAMVVAVVAMVVAVASAILALYIYIEGQQSMREGESRKAQALRASVHITQISPTMEG